MSYARGNHVAVSLGKAKFHIDGLMASLGLCHKVRQVQIRVRTGHKVHSMV